MAALPFLIIWSTFSPWATKYVCPHSDRNTVWGMRTQALGPDCLVWKPGAVAAELWEPDALLNFFNPQIKKKSALAGVAQWLRGSQV